MRRLAVALLLLPLTQTACFWVLAGGAGYGGYRAGKDDRDLGTQLDDAALTSRVKTKLLADSQVSGLDINVDSYQGVVTLSGHVERSREAERAVAITRGVSGVREVHSRLVVLSD